MYAESLARPNVETPHSEMNAQVPQRSDAELIAGCPICSMRKCECGFLTDNVVRRRHFIQGFEQQCYRCGGDHSALLCASPDQQTLERIILYQAHLLSQKGREEFNDPPFNSNSSSNRPQCVNCGSQRHTTTECYFPAQNELRHPLYLTRKQREQMLVRGYRGEGSIQ